MPGGLGNVAVDPVSGAALQEIIAKVMKTPPAVIAKAKSFLESGRAVVRGRHRACGLDDRRLGQS